MRVAYVLILRQDSIQNVEQFNRERYLVTVYQNAVTALGIPDYKFYVGRTSKQLKIRTLTGLQVFRVEELLPRYTDANRTKQGVF